MTGKAKPKKHTAKEIAAKIDAATTNRGGGKAGMADRTGIEKGGHAKYECPHCKTTAPDLKSMQIHHEARHPKLPYEEDKLINRHAALAVETSKGRPGIRGSLKNVFSRVAAVIFSLPKSLNRMFRKAFEFETANPM
ncbi:hypothetical protein F8388_026520 [Cannabis sativa]|uniref:Uncharacterized protein n=1 Tax=Cannabis sativa TaxID=3483 RepID=A0A7J6EBG1_CANSA|nr:hypothetical protein F8388_026520 [Cannabis sativa]